MRLHIVIDETVFFHPQFLEDLIQRLLRGGGIRLDVIISSQSLYFGKKILEIPVLCCINRHSGLLPNNGGLWPGFQAVRKGEPETGVSVHTYGQFRQRGGRYV